MSRILVTGASGFLGSWMTRYLVQNGLNVRVLCRPSSDLEELKGLDYEVQEGDITDAASLHTAVKGVEAVFHFAGLIAYTTSQRQLMEKINVGGTQNVIDACKKGSVSRLVHISSVVAVGATRNGKYLLNEDSSYNLSSYNLGYPETKHRSEELVLEATQDGSLDAVIVNPSNVYGAGDARKGSRRTQLKVARGKFPFYTHGGVNIVSVEDVVAATFNAWRKGRKGERYILAGENVTIKQLFQYIAKAANVRSPHLYLPTPAVIALGRFGDIMEKYGRRGPLNSENAFLSTLFHWYDPAKARQELQLKVTPAQESIAKSVQWMRETGLIRS